LCKLSGYGKIFFGNTKTVGGSPLRGLTPQNFHSERGDRVLRVGNKTEGLHMLTLEGFIAVIGLCASMFALGYAVGRNDK
jgi:hypothetical protein